LRAKTQDEKLINQILEELVEETFTYSESTLLNEVDLKFKEFLAQRIIQGDAFEEMTKLEPESIDLIVTDPPYNISDPSKLTKKGGEIVELDIADWDKQTEEEYEQFILKLLLAIKRLLKPSGSFYLFLDKAFSGRAWKMCKEIGLKPKNIVHWRKTNPVPQVRKNNYLSAIEHILYGVKGEKYTFNFKSDNEMHNVIELPIETGLERQRYPHETAKPLELIEHLIEVSSNPKDLVLDPFAGRGTTAIACINKGRNWIVIEKDPRHVKTIKRWVEERGGTNEN
jgi:DNA modification methylase